MTKNEILQWLKETDPGRLADLWEKADQVRKENVGDEVHLRGLIEASNICVRQCRYCGINAAQGQQIPRYRMTVEEMQGCVKLAVKFGYGTIVVQAGEDYGLTKEMVAGFIRWVKDNTELAITLSLGREAKLILLPGTNRGQIDIY